MFISERTGGRIKVDSLRAAKGRIDQQAKASALGITYNHFTFHDLKRKGATDTTGNKQEAGGHCNAAMLNIYDVKPIVVKARLPERNEIPSSAKIDFYLNRLKALKMVG